VPIDHLFEIRGTIGENKKSEDRRWVEVIGKE